MGPLAEIQRPSSFHPTALFLDGHRRPRLYRTCILSQSISLFKYPSELSAKPHWGEASGHFDPQIVRTNRFRLLMQELYGRHFLAALGGFDAVPDQDQPAIDRYEAWEQLQHSLRPQGRKPVELDAAAVKVIQQLGVEPGPQVQGAHDAGDAEQFHPH